MTFGITRAALDAIVQHARRDLPNECCGLLVGTDGHIEEARPAANLRLGPTRYLIDPEAHFRALRESRASGRIVVGAYHSHPRGPSSPSQTDIEEANDPALVHLIVSLEHDEPVAHAFRLCGGDYTEIELAITARRPRGHPGGS